MEAKIFDRDGVDMAWCPGCGNFQILKTLKKALAATETPPQKLVMVSGIGQAAKIPHYFRCHVFNGLHGRALPPAFAIQAVNPELTVIAESGDGDMYGEGGNHFLHTIRRNPRIVNIVHNNMVYGLTKGQASPTSQRGFTTPVQTGGVILEPFNPLAVAIALDASFVARTFCGDAAMTQRIMEAAIRHNGYALIDVLQPCVTYNKVNNFRWFKNHVVPVPDEHDPTDRQAAFRLACTESSDETLPVGLLYRNPSKRPYHEQIGTYRNDARPLWRRERDPEALADLIRER